MKSLLLKKSNLALGLSCLALLSSCGSSPSSPSSSESGLSSEESSLTSEDPMDKVFQDYVTAESYSLLQKDIGVTFSSPSSTFGVETRESGTSTTWNDFSLTCTDFAFDFAVNDLGKGKNKMAASFEMPSKAKISISGSNLPSWVGTVLAPKMQTNLYFDSGVLYLDLSNQPLLNVIITSFVREMSDDSTWKLPSQSHYTLTDDENRALNLLAAYISEIEASDSAYRKIYETSPTSISSSESAGKETLTINIVDEASLKNLLVSTYENKDDLIDLVDSLLSEFIPDFDIPLDFDVSKEEFVEEVDELLQCFEFNHYNKEIVFSPASGISHQEAEFVIDSFDREKMISYLEELHEKEASSSESSGEEVYEVTSLPKGKWKLGSSKDYQFGSAVEATILTDTEKEDYSAEITIPEFKEE